MGKMIKMCPHCGGKPGLYCDISKKYKKPVYFTYVQCDICGARGKTTSSQKNPEQYDWDTAACNTALEAWNMRVSVSEEGCDEKECNENG